MKKEYTVEAIFRPGTKIEIVFDIDSTIPVVRKSRLHECDSNTHEMILSQTNPRILPSFRYKSMSLTTLVHEELNVQFRAGIESRIIHFLKDYQLSDSQHESAIIVKYQTSIQKMNIRSAFRLEPTAKFDIGGKLIFKGVTYHAGTDYKIHDISNTGIGLMIPKQTNHGQNALKYIDIKDKALIELELVDFTSNNKRVTLSTEIVIVRKNIDYNPKSGFIGIKFAAADRDFERILGKFIHEVQLYERRMATKALM